MAMLVSLYCHYRFYNLHIITVCTHCTRGLNIQVLDVQGVLLDEIPSWLHLVPH